MTEATVFEERPRVHQYFSKKRSTTEILKEPYFFHFIN